MRIMTMLGNFCARTFSIYNGCRNCKFFNNCWDLSTNLKEIKNQPNYNAIMFESTILKFKLFFRPRLQESNKVKSTDLERGLSSSEATIQTQVVEEQVIPYHLRRLRGGGGEGNPCLACCAILLGLIGLFSFVYDLYLGISEGINLHGGHV